MSKESFESLNEYQKTSDSKTFVNESLILEKDDDGVLGSIIDRGLSFVPRAMRFKKAKKIMRKSLNKFTFRAKNIIKKFVKSFKNKVATIEKEYNKLIKDKIKPLMKEGKNDQAVKLMKENLKEFEAYKKEQMQLLDKGISDVLDAYTNAIHNRIDNPGFILNVELSERGKGELKAKWQELIAIQKIKVEEFKTELVKSPGWKRLDEIISEMTAFVEQREKPEADIDFHIQDIEREASGNFLVRVHIRARGGRPVLEEKGLIIGTDANKLDHDRGAHIIKVTGKYQHNMNPYTLSIDSSAEGKYVKPYLILKNQKDPIYGDIGVLKARVKTKEEKRAGEEKIIGKSRDGDLGGETDIIKKEKK